MPNPSQLGISAGPVSAPSQLGGNASRAGAQSQAGSVSPQASNPPAGSMRLPQLGKSAGTQSQTGRITTPGRQC